MEEGSDEIERKLAAPECWVFLGSGLLRGSQLKPSELFQVQIWAELLVDLERWGLLCERGRERRGKRG